MPGESIVQTWISLIAQCSHKHRAGFQAWLTSVCKPEVSLRWAPWPAEPSGSIETLKRHPHSIFQLSSRQFELLVAKLLSKRGFLIQITPATHDGGTDMLAYLYTGVSKFLCLIQTKRYRRDRPVGVATVRELYGVMKDHGANQAMIVTTSSSSRYAQAFAQRHEHQISLQDHGALMQWIREFRH